MYACCKNAGTAAKCIGEGDISTCQHQGLNVFAIMGGEYEHGSDQCEANIEAEQDLQAFQHDQCRENKTGNLTNGNDPPGNAEIIFCEFGPDSRKKQQDQ